jgi:hypothetical protein
MRIVCQIGYSKSLGRKKEGQKVQVSINDVECTWGDSDDGQYLTSIAETRKGVLWYLWGGEVEHGDTVCLKVATAIVGGGTDEKRTFESIYVVDEDSDVREVSAPRVGKPGYPLLKGRVVELGSVSKSDEREAEAEAFLADENF